MLVVDDFIDLVTVLLHLVESRGYRAEGAFDGATGLERARHLVPDLVVLDHQMPLLSGAEVARVLKREPQTAHIKILMHSATEESHIRQIFDGYDRYHPKIADPVPLLDVIDSLLGKA